MNHPVLEQLQERRDLEENQVDSFIEFLLSAEEPDDLKAAVLKALHEKGETPQEIANLARGFLRLGIAPELNAAGLPGPMVDVCGTGGDRMDLFNVSTTAMFIVAASGAVVVKHGNRGVTSKCGGADVLEKLGVRIDHCVDDFRRCVETVGVGFMFAPLYHPAFKAIVPVRKQLAAEGYRTVFNMLGPLLNPANPPYQLAGVFSAALLSTYAEVFKLLGRRAAWAVHGTTHEGKGLDEISTMGVTRVTALREGSIEEMTIDPANLGLTPTTAAELRGGDAESNARILVSILDGTEQGPKRDMALLNAAGALVVTGLADDLSRAVRQAADLVDTGQALAKLEALRDFD